MSAATGMLSVIKATLRTLSRPMSRSASITASPISPARIGDSFRRKRASRPQAGGARPRLLTSTGPEGDGERRRFLNTDRLSDASDADGRRVRQGLWLVAQERAPGGGMIQVGRRRRRDRAAMVDATD
jgi:hypothetical protein